VFVTIAVLIVLASAIALFLGERIVLLAGVGMLLAVLYSAYPVRAKRNGWVGNALVALSYEGLPWLAGHLAFATLSPLSLIMAGLYSFGTHGIMTINDFKSIDGDRRTNIKTIPVLYGPHRAALTIILTMTIAQVAAAAVMLIQGRWWAGGLILVFFLAQIPLQRTFLRDPITNAVKFSAGSSGLYVLGMLVAAIGV
jgi:chlorophyll synthase